MVKLLTPDYKEELSCYMTSKLDTSRHWPHGARAFGVCMSQALPYATEHCMVLTLVLIRAGMVPGLHRADPCLRVGCNHERARCGGCIVLTLDLG